MVSVKGPDSEGMSGFLSPAVFELKLQLFFLEKMHVDVGKLHVFSPTSGWIDNFSILGEGTMSCWVCHKLQSTLLFFWGVQSSVENETLHRYHIIPGMHSASTPRIWIFFSLKRFSAWRNPRNQSRSSFWETAARCHESPETEIAKTSDYETMGGTWLWQASSATRWTRVTWRLCYTQFFWSQSDTLILIGFGLLLQEFDVSSTTCHLSIFQFARVYELPSKVSIFF